MVTTSTTSPTFLPVRQAWLDRRREEIIEPALPIIDPHHHLWDRPDWRYLLPDLLDDVNTGHNLVATVFLQCRTMHRAAGPEEMRPVGETEFVNGVAAMSASGGYGKTRVCAGIVGHVDLAIGARAKGVLEAHVRAGGGRFRGIRHSPVWDADPELQAAYIVPPGLMEDSGFRAGFSELAPMDMSFDAWLYYTQIDGLAALARAFEGTRIVLNHCGGPLGIRGYAGRRDEVFAAWSKSIRALAQCPNVFVKLGGLGMRLNGFGFETKPEPPSSDDLVAAWRPYIETCVEAFGAARCMFESNFPVDKGSYSYPVFWNACKKLAHGGSEAEKTNLFSATAARFYKLGG